jgi:hypothetical protein
MGEGQRVANGKNPADGRGHQGRGDGRLSVSPPQVRVEPVAGDPWKDFGYWLEAVAVMAQYARDAQGWDNERILDYTRDYLAKAVGDFNLRDRLLRGAWYGLRSHERRRSLASIQPTAPCGEPAWLSDGAYCGNHQHVVQRPI